MADNGDRLRVIEFETALLAATRQIGGDNHQKLFLFARA
jgi:hypothetical protein